MFFYKFTNGARRVLSRANQAAHSRNNERIGTEHILQGLAEEESGKAFQALKNLNISLENIVHAINKVTRMECETMPSKTIKLPQTRRARRVVKNAIAESRKYKSRIVGTEHMLLGLLNIPESSAVRVLESMGFTSDQVRQEVFNLHASIDKSLNRISGL